jgi:hypothetical protein
MIMLAFAKEGVVTVLTSAITGRRAFDAAASGDI